MELSQLVGVGENEEIAKLLLDRGADVNALQAAAWKGNQEVIKLLLDRGADVNAQGGEYGNALQAAVLKRNQEIVKLLLDRGADVNAQGGEFGNALQATAWNGKQEIVKLLLDRGADVNAQGGEYGNALQAAALDGKQETVKLLLDRGADVNAQGGEFGNALQAAAWVGNQEMVKLLLDRGANVNAQGGYYGNALQAAASNGNQETMKLLLDHGADVNAQGGRFGNALQATAWDGNQEMVKLLFDCGVDVNAQGGEYSNALQAVVWNGKQETVKLLLDRGADVNAQGGKHGNALQVAAWKGNQETVKLLLDRGANVNAQGGYYGNALQVAVWYGNQETVKLLLDRGADVNAQGGYYGNALQAAASNGKQETVKLLLDRGADVNAQGGEYGNALQAAALKRNQEIVKLLLDRGADVNAQGGKYGNALQAAALDGKQEMVKLLLDRGADVNAQGGEYGNALQAAAWVGNQEVIKLLLDRGSDITIQPRSTNRLSMLHVCVASGSTMALKVLLDAGGAIHLDTQDESGQTPLHVAVEKRDILAAKYLLERGGSTDIPDFSDTTPFQLAIQSGFSQMALLTFSKTKYDPSSLSATDWRRCLAPGLACHIEMTSCEPPEVLVWNDASKLKMELDDLSYPLSSYSDKLPARETDFMSRKNYAKRIFILADDSSLHDGPEFDLRCRWWRKVPQEPKFENTPQNLRPLSKSWNWTIQMSSPPTMDTVRRTPASTCFLECGLFVTCIFLPAIEEWPETVDHLERFAGDHKQRHGILWIMVKPEAHEAKSNSTTLFLCSKFSFSTSEFAGVPVTAIDLFIPLIQRVRSIWDHNFDVFETRLLSTRSMVLKSGGNDQNLVQELLKDAQLLELLIANLKKQVNKFRIFKQQYTSDAWRVLHEHTPGQLKEEMDKVDSEIQKLREGCERRLTDFMNSSQNIIQLEFNLTSIAEAQKSTRTNRSMKRLSWITFIFLPLLFIASLFGMNVDILENNPAWWWYIPLAALLMFITFTVWIIFKRSEGLEDNLEQRFDRLFRFGRPFRQNKEDVERGLDQSEQIKRKRTAAYSTSGKKRS